MHKKHLLLRQRFAQGEDAGVEERASDARGFHALPLLFRPHRDPAGEVEVELLVAQTREAYVKNLYATN